MNPPHDLIESVPVPVRGPERARATGDRRRRARRVVLAGVAAVVLVVAGSAVVLGGSPGTSHVETAAVDPGERGDPPATTDTRSTATAPNDPVVVGPEPQAGTAHMTALLPGLLRYDADRGCLLWGDNPVIWPFGTRWQPDPAGVILPNGTTALVGSTGKFAGGFLPGNTLGHLLSPDDVARIERCAGPSGQVALINP